MNWCKGASGEVPVGTSRARTQGGLVWTFTADETADKGDGVRRESL